MKKKVFNIIQIGDKSNRLSRLFDIFIAIVICANILVTFLQTFDELAFLFPAFHVCTDHDPMPFSGVRP